MVEQKIQKTVRILYIAGWVKDTQRAISQSKINERRWLLGIKCYISAAFEKGENSGFAVMSV